MVPSARATSALVEVWPPSTASRTPASMACSILEQAQARPVALDNLAVQIVPARHVHADDSRGPVAALLEEMGRFHHEGVHQRRPHDGGGRADAYPRAVQID